MNRGRLFRLLSALFVGVLTCVLHAGGTETVRMRVEGMRCRSCAHDVGRSIRKASRVDSVRVDVQRGLVEVWCDSAASRMEAIKGAVLRNGFNVNTIEIINQPTTNERKNHE